MKLKEFQVTVEEKLRDDWKFPKKMIDFIKKGYEGMSWDDWDDFISKFQGYDILLKTQLVIEKKYRPWADITELGDIFKSNYPNLKKLVKSLKK